MAASLSSYSQGDQDLRDIKVEELTEVQLRQVSSEADRRGMSIDELSSFAQSKGMSPVEIAKLKIRLQALRKSNSENRLPSKPNISTGSATKDSITSAEERPVRDFNQVFSYIKPGNFGADVFANSRISFEPSLNIPTPKNYQLGPDDEITIDVSGYSEASYRLKVSREGVIRIPVAGPIAVNGMTIETAKKIITQKLASTIYSNIRSGNTKVEVTLSTIRSIKVTIIGEATSPGTYTLPSLASAYNALYACGGPNVNGSYRNIQIIRNNAVISTIDVYKFLQDGTRRDDISLKDQDIIKINSYQTRIELKGEVKKTGLFDVLKGETLGKIIQFAGGYTDNAYTAHVQVFRNTNKERQVATLNENDIESAVPRGGDTYIISKILNRFANRISIEGAIYRPGEYELKENATLTQLIKQADGLREDAFTNRAVIHRLKDDLSPEIISIDLEKLLNGTDPDIKLKKEDRVSIYSKFDLKEGYYISIEGEVSNPGVFLFEDSLSVYDVILQAGGLKEGASLNRVQISRRIKNADVTAANAATAVIFSQDISSSLRDSSALNSFYLIPFDEITIRPAPGYSVQKNVVIEGEVLYTGRYSIEAKNDRISDLIARAGGLTPAAYLDGAVLIRTKNPSKNERTNYEQGLNSLITQNFQAGTSPILLQNQIERSAQAKSESIGIDLKKIIADPKSKFDLLLAEGDSLRIPKLLQTVRVSGEVLYPALIRFDKGMSFRDYINGAGGFTERSAKRRAYAVYANGSAKGTRSFLFIKNYPKLKPGTEIFVPIRRERERLRTGEIVSIGATLVTLVAVLFTVLK